MMASDSSRPMYSARPGYEAVMVPGYMLVEDGDGAEDGGYRLVEDGAEGYIDCEDGGGGWGTLG